MSIAVKICGLKDLEALNRAISKGAQYVGFVFYPRSPRALSPAEGKILTTAVPRSVKSVGVVVDADDTFLDTLLSAVPLDMLQCHGKETAARVSEIRNRFNVPIVKAISVSEASDLEGADCFQDVADMILFDSMPPTASERPGGNALSFRWSLLRAHAVRRPWMLAGGLGVANLAEAVRVSGARAVDVSSGVEDFPGRKDLAKIDAFLDLAAVL